MLTYFRPIIEIYLLRDFDSALVFVNPSHGINTTNCFAPRANPEISTNSEVE